MLRALGLLTSLVLLLTSTVSAANYKIRPDVDDHGRTVEPGVYYTRLEAGTTVRSQGVLLTP